MYRIDFKAPSWKFSKKDVTVEDAEKMIKKIKKAIAKEEKLTKDKIEISDYLVYEDKEGFKYFDCIMQVDRYYMVFVHYYYE
jgi:hypothetical protein